mmetsp:Transcript_17307/g.29628  ORF Transcript_17307/g.29628 Transcript_17307/m.29628 type:complete len:84 (-) Transcript_17307:2827-3078(-)
MQFAESALEDDMQVCYSELSHVHPHGVGKVVDTLPCREKPRDPSPKLSLKAGTLGEQNRFLGPLLTTGNVTPLVEFLVLSRGS